MDYTLLLFSAVILTSYADENPEPAHTWPLSNMTLYGDTAGDSDILHDRDKICFSFVPGPPDLGHSVLELSDENSQFDMILSGDDVLKDLSLSFYIYPNAEETELSGTLLHYTYEEREIMKIRCLANTFLVSFRDEYGMSAGMMYLVNFLKPTQWNHVILTRDYQTGTITVYLDGVEKYNEDDDFSDIISFPGGGKLRIGKSQDPDDEDAFDGNFACIEIFESVIDNGDIEKVREYCLTNKDGHKEVYYEEKNGKSCLTDPPPAPDTNPGNLVTMTTLTNGVHWLAFLDHFDLDDSGETNQKFELKSSDKKSTSLDDLIGQFNVTDVKVCTRLCMRVDTCEAFILEPYQDTIGSYPCSLYKDASMDLTESSGAKFYAVQSKSDLESGTSHSND